MKLLALLFFAGVAASSAADTVLQEIKWSQLAAGGQLRSGTVVSTPGEPEALKIENPDAKPLISPVVVFEQPKITANFYRLLGEVRYDDVEGQGFLEMWNYFAGGGAYFSRTLGETGPMAALRGTSGWRPFILPFNATGANGQPTKLEVNLHLPGKGTVHLRSLRLDQPSDTSAVGAVTPPGAWWSDRATAWAGGIGGAILGILGSLMEWLAAKGRSRGFVTITARVLIVFGIAATVVGLLAVILKQPYGVWYALLLFGVICVVAFPARLRRYEARYRELELRRMTALDAA